MGTFLRRGIEDACPAGIETFAAEALASYAKRWSPMPLPWFLAEAPPCSDGRSISLPVDAELYAFLVAEGERQGASVEAIARHALFVHLAAADPRGRGGRAGRNFVASTPARRRPRR